MFSVITSHAFNNDHASLTQICHILTSKFLLKIKLPVKNNQIHMSLTVRLIKCLPPKIGW